MLHRTYKFRLYPTRQQSTKMQHILDTCRWVYNKTLETRHEAWQENKETLSYYDTLKLLTQWRKNDSWVSSGHAQTQQNAQARVDRA